MIKEACVEGITEAIKAQELGADRIELCENLYVGGTTPSLGTLIACKKHLRIPIITMIRPRGGNFVYNSIEAETMIHDIKACADAGINGIAIGMLTSNHTIDFPLLKQLLEFKGNMQVTFHKAIDVTGNILEQFRQLKESQLVDRVLTSGGANTAEEGSEVLKKMLALSESKLKIVVAGKVTLQNINSLQKLIPADEFHGKKIVGDLNIVG